MASNLDHVSIPVDNIFADFLYLIVFFEKSVAIGSMEWRVLKTQTARTRGDLNVFNLEKNRIPAVCRMGVLLEWRTMRINYMCRV